MSCDWNIWCRTCNDEHSFNDANHQEALMHAIIENAACIAALVPLFSDKRNIGCFEFGVFYGPIHPEWFKKHLGHDLVARSEYGQISEGKGSLHECRCTTLDNESKPRVWVRCCSRSSVC